MKKIKKYLLAMVFLAMMPVFVGAQQSEETTESVDINSSVVAKEDPAIIDYGSLTDEQVEMQKNNVNIDEVLITGEDAMDRNISFQVTLSSNSDEKETVRYAVLLANGKIGSTQPEHKLYDEMISVEPGQGEKVVEISYYLPQELESGYYSIYIVLATENGDVIEGNSFFVESFDVENNTVSFENLRASINQKLEENYDYNRGKSGDKKSENIEENSEQVKNGGAKALFALLALIPLVVIAYFLVKKIGVNNKVGMFLGVVSFSAVLFITNANSSLAADIHTGVDMDVCAVDIPSRGCYTHESVTVVAPEAGYYSIKELGNVYRGNMVHSHYRMGGKGNCPGAYELGGVYHFENQAFEDFYVTVNRGGANQISIDPENDECLFSSYNYNGPGPEDDTWVLIASTDTQLVGDEYLFQAGHNTVTLHHGIEGYHLFGFSSRKNSVQQSIETSTIGTQSVDIDDIVFQFERPVGPTEITCGSANGQYADADANNMPIFDFNANPACPAGSSGAIPLTWNNSRNAWEWWCEQNGNPSVLSPMCYLNKNVPPATCGININGGQFSNLSANSSGLCEAGSQQTGFQSTATGWNWRCVNANNMSGICLATRQPAQCNAQATNNGIPFGSKITEWPFDTSQFNVSSLFCNQGVVSVSGTRGTPPLFPDQGETSNWACFMMDGSSASCSASRADACTPNYTCDSGPTGNSCSNPNNCGMTITTDVGYCRNENGCELNNCALSCSHLDRQKTCDPCPSTNVNSSNWIEVQ